MSKSLQKQLALAMQQMIIETGAPLIKKLETLQQIINFSLAMAPADADYRENLQAISDNLSKLIDEEYEDYFEDPEVVCGREELLFRMKAEGLHGDVSRVINDQRLIPASFMDSVEDIEKYIKDDD